MKVLVVPLCFACYLIAAFVCCSTEGTHTSEVAADADADTEISRLTSVAYDHPYFATGDSLFGLNNYEQAIAAYCAALRKFRSEKNAQGIIRSLNLLGYNHRVLGDYPKSLGYLDSALTMGQAQLPEGNLIGSETHYYLGQYYDENGDTLQAFRYHRLALDNRLKKLGPLHKEVSKSLNAIGNIYRFLKYDYENAEKFYLKSLSIKEHIARLAGPTRDLAISYYNLATTSRLKGNYDNVLLYSGKALVILEKDSTKNSAEIANCYNAIANGYYEKGEYDQSIRHGLRALDILKRNQRLASSTGISCLNNAGRSYYQTRNFSEAKKYYVQALQLSVETNRNFSDIAYCYLNLGDVYKDMHMADSAFHYLHACLKIRMQNYSLKHPETSFALYSLGNAFVEFSQHDSALFYFQRALVAGVPDFDSAQLASNPSPDHVGRHFNIPFVLCAKAQALMNKFDRDTSNLALVRNALSIFSLAEKGLIGYQRSYNGDDAKLDIARHAKQIYEGMLRCTCILYREKKDADHARVFTQSVYDIFWKSKARVLREGIERASANSGDTLLDNLVKRESALERELNANLMETRLHVTRTSDTLREAAYRINQQLNAVKKQISHDYPSYYNTFYAETLDIQNVKKYYREQQALLIEYFWGTRDLYVLAVHDDFFTLKIYDRDTISKMVDVCLATISTPPLLSGGEPGFKAFTHASFQLGQQLVAPFLADEKNKNTFTKIIIVPDGDLVLLPFEALVTSLPKSDNVNYRALDYLVKQYPVAYRYLSYAPEWTKKEKQLPGKLLAIGHEYRDRNNRTAVLPGVREEIESVHEIIDGKMLMNETASKENFKANLAKFNLIHLSLHGSASRNGMNTQINFYTTPESTDDGALRLHELYTLRIPARMVSLAACESGFGKEYRGEGIYSMARGFSYAGCRTLVAGLFDVNNLSAIALSKNFYQNIRSGHEIDYSLQRAKLNYIERADEISAHPSAWASLVVIGDTAPVLFEPENKIPVLFIIFSTLAIVTSLVFVFRKLRYTRTTP